MKLSTLQFSIFLPSPYGFLFTPIIQKFNDCLVGKCIFPFHASLNCKIWPYVTKYIAQSGGSVAVPVFDITQNSTLNNNFLSYENRSQTLFHPTKCAMCITSKEHKMIDSIWHLIRNNIWNLEITIIIMISYKHIFHSVPGECRNGEPLIIFQSIQIGHYNIKQKCVVHCIVVTSIIAKNIRRDKTWLLVTIVICIDNYQRQQLRGRKKRKRKKKNKLNLKDKRYAQITLNQIKITERNTKLQLAISHAIIFHLLSNLAVALQTNCISLYYYVTRVFYERIRIRPNRLFFFLFFFSSFKRLCAWSLKFEFIISELFKNNIIYRMDHLLARSNIHQVRIFLFLSIIIDYFGHNWIVSVMAQIVYIASISTSDLMCCIIVGWMFHFISVLYFLQSKKRIILGMNKRAKATTMALILGNITMYQSQFWIFPFILHYYYLLK